MTFGDASWSASNMSHSSHPSCTVRWFESYYNFRWRHKKSGLGDLPNADTMTSGECLPDMQGVCLEHANFHSHLAMFGKTNLSDPVEQRLVHVPDKYNEISRIDNPVFLYDMEQLYDNNPHNVARFKTDLQAFMGLDTPLPDDSAVAKQTHRSKNFQKMNICDEQYSPLRAELVQIGTRAGLWIRKYFIKSSRVVVSNPSAFDAILKKWELDPCDEAGHVSVQQ